MRDKSTKKSKGYGFASFSDQVRRAPLAAGRLPYPTFDAPPQLLRKVERVFLLSVRPRFSSPQAEMYKVLKEMEGKYIGNRPCKARVCSSGSRCRARYAPAERTPASPAWC